MNKNRDENIKRCRSVGMVDKIDLKSIEQMLVWVRVPPLVRCNDSSEQMRGEERTRYCNWTGFDTLCAFNRIQYSIDKTEINTGPIR